MTCGGGFGSGVVIINHEHNIVTTNTIVLKSKINDLLLSTISEVRLGGGREMTR